MEIGTCFFVTDPGSTTGYKWIVATY